MASAYSEITPRIRRGREAEWRTVPYFIRSISTGTRGTGRGTYLEGARPIFAKTHRLSSKLTDSETHRLIEDAL